VEAKLNAIVLKIRSAKKVSADSTDTNPTRPNGQSNNGSTDVANTIVDEVNGNNDDIAALLQGKQLHLVVGADHAGGGSFKAQLGLNLVEEGKVIHYEKILVAVAECRKDTRQVLLNSGVMKAIDDGLKATPSSLQAHHGGGMLAARISIFGSFDLAANALLLGKCNMSGKYCWRCHWRHGADEPCKECQAWTLETMKQHREKTDTKEQETGKKIKGKQRMGLVKPPLLTCIPVRNWLTPILHCITLFANTPFNYLTKWVWHRVDDLPIELIVARDIKTEALIHKDECQSMLRDMEEHLNNQRGQLVELEPEGEVFASHEHFQLHNLQLQLVASAQLAVDEASQSNGKGCR
jgi:hypothetical protein